MEFPIVVIAFGGLAQGAADKRDYRKGAKTVGVDLDRCALGGEENGNEYCYDSAVHDRVPIGLTIVVRINAASKVSLSALRLIAA